MSHHKTITIREANPSDAEQLTTLALLSKAHWGYPDEWIQLWYEDLAVTPELLSQSFAFVAEYEGEIIGFWTRWSQESEDITLGRLFIHPDHIGKGIGRLLWTKIKASALKAGIKKFTIEADPNAAGFYRKLGFKQIGERESQVIPGRKLPIMTIGF